MKKIFVFFCFLIIISHNASSQEVILQGKNAQEKIRNDSNLLDLDTDSFDSLFDEPLTETTEEESAASSSVLGSVKKRGLVAIASYEVKGSFAPGWDKNPWEFDGNEKISWGLGGKITSSITIDAQITEYFRALTTVNFNIPNFKFDLGDFFFDYSFFNYVFLRTGKYEHSWGITSFTNLLARIPEDSDGGPSFVIKADVPIGVGGLQLLAQTRSDIMNGIFPKIANIGFGGKYNIALRWIDIDTGILYQGDMPLRAFVSLKTTLWNTEFYNEWLLAVNTHTDKKAGFSANIGFVRDFWNGKITVGGEFFYNGEGTTYYYRSETNLREAEPVEFAKSFRLSTSFLYRIGGYGSPRLFLSVNYLPTQSSAEIIPGFRFTPFKNIDVYLAVPVVLGSKDGYYYRNSTDVSSPNLSQPRPFKIMLLVTLSGSVRAGYYY